MKLFGYELPGMSSLILWGLLWGACRASGIDLLFATIVGNFSDIDGNRYH